MEKFKLWAKIKANITKQVFNKNAVRLNMGGKYVHFVFGQAKYCK